MVSELFQTCSAKCTVDKYLMYCWHAHISICQITVCLMHLFLKCITVHAKIRSFLPSDNKEREKIPLLHHLFSSSFSYCFSLQSKKLRSSADWFSPEQCDQCLFECVAILIRSIARFLLYFFLFSIVCLQYSSILIQFQYQCDICLNKSCRRMYLNCLMTYEKPEQRQLGMGILRLYYFVPLGSTKVKNLGGLQSSAKTSLDLQNDLWGRLGISILLVSCAERKQVL